MRISLSYTKTLAELTYRCKKLNAALKAEYPLKSLSISVSGANLFLNIIVVDKAASGQGVGRKVVQRLIDFAQQNYLTLHATPADKSDDLGTTSKERLYRFYSSLGLKRSRSSTKTGIPAGTMYLPAPPVPDGKALSKLFGVFEGNLTATSWSVEAALEKVAAEYPPIIRSKNSLTYPLTTIRFAKTKSGSVIKIV